MFVRSTVQVYVFMSFLHVRFCSVSVRETELGLTCSVRFGQNGETLLRSVTTTHSQVFDLTNHKTALQSAFLWMVERWTTIFDQIHTFSPWICYLNFAFAPTFAEYSSLKQSSNKKSKFNKYLTENCSWFNLWFDQS